jgi:hypothetical protein
VETYAISEAERAKLEGMRVTMMRQLFRTLNRDHRPVDTDGKA